MDSLGAGRMGEVLATPAAEQLGILSPDGRWLAYVSDESGADEVYVRPFSPGGDSSGVGPKWLVSVNGGRFPHWSGDGKQLAYLDRETLHVVDVATAPVFRAGARQSFAPAPLTLAGAIPPDPKRMLLAIPVSNSAAPVLNVLLHWPSVIK